ncbi:hypothetical protein BDZ94DRAFT_292388 [Collybia nuda]|uniref:Uncharacterized protein n=1 Tax=Collybia nuda TaxID=64659 RepID=A0A9P5XWF1_9AGAR|nr:hypothetical protein BDZ94DRAFT_292388 [Collybia nuda]
MIWMLIQMITIPYKKKCLEQNGPRRVLWQEEVNRVAGIETSSPLAAITPEVNKRKAEGPRQGTLKKSKTQPGGLFPNWEKTHHSHPQLPHHHNTNSSSGYSGVSDFENDANESKSSPAFGYGGILSENEEVEWLASKESRTISRHQVVTKIEPIHRVPYINVSRQLSKKKTKKLVNLLALKIHGPILKTLM